MFGQEYRITPQFPEYFLDYREKLDPRIRWTDRVQTQSGDFSGNVFDFFNLVYPKVTADFKKPFMTEGPYRIEETPKHLAVREAIANCLVNADYFQRWSVVIERYPDRIVLSNPGTIIPGKKQMLKGGISEPRNRNLFKMFIGGHCRPMIRILFICHGNICRSAAAEMVLRKMARDHGMEADFQISSAATSREEIGNDIYPPMKKALHAEGIPCHPHAARQVTREEYAQWDYIIGMDDENMWNLRRLYGNDPEGKLSLLMDWAGQPGQEIDDPWYTRDFRGALRQIEKGCQGLWERIIYESGWMGRS